MFITRLVKVSGKQENIRFSISNFDSVTLPNYLEVFIRLKFVYSLITKNIRISLDGSKVFQYIFRVLSVNIKNPKNVAYCSALRPYNLKNLVFNHTNPTEEDKKRLLLSADHE